MSEERRRCIGESSLTVMHLTYVTRTHAYGNRQTCAMSGNVREKDRGGGGQQVQDSRGRGAGGGIHNFLAPIVLLFLEQDKTAIQNDPG